jgi:ABC-type Mn2+/Zn2+ transport system ATPase subunit
MSSSEVVLSCENLSIGYGEEVVLSGINLSIRQGSFLPFIGPNGVGKTTLLRTILGFIPPLAGKIKLTDEFGCPGYVAQFSTLDRLYPVTAREVIQMGLYPQLGFWKKPDKAMNTKVDRIIERFNLLNHSDRPIEELSGGMRQKVMIGRALMTGSNVLIMDEPASGLDEASEVDLIALLFRLAQEEKKTVLFAQHSIEPILDYAQQVCSFAAGKVRILPIDELVNGRKVFMSAAGG